MKLRALATDYDGTLASMGEVHEHTLHALLKLKRSGRMLILVTGRRLPDLKAVFPDYRLFDRIVAENGALLLAPASGRERLLAPPASQELVAELEARGVTPIEMGRAIIGTLTRNQRVVMESVRMKGLDLVPILNKESLMLLPPGVDKATGLRAALTELELPAESVVGVGDAENDLTLFEACGVKAAVANAVPELLEAADLRLSLENGAGVVELIEKVFAPVLATASPSA